MYLVENRNLVKDTVSILLKPYVTFPFAATFDILCKLYRQIDQFLIHEVLVIGTWQIIMTVDR